MSEEQNDQYEYLEVEVTRTQGTTVMMRVPKGFDRKNLKGDLLAKACKDTVEDYEWDSYGWEGTVEWQAIKSIPKEEATQYVVYNVE
jgi:hypothetical protein